MEDVTEAPEAPRFHRLPTTYKCFCEKLVFDTTVYILLLSVCVEQVSLVHDTLSLNGTQLS